MREPECLQPWWSFPSWFIDVWWGYFWNLVLPASSMIVYSAILDQIRGRMKASDLAGLTYVTRDVLPEEAQKTVNLRLQVASNWLERTRAELEPGPIYPFSTNEKPLVWYRQDKLLVWIFLSIMVFLNLVVFW